MRTDPATPADLQASFNQVVDGITTGEFGMCPTGFGFNDTVFTALNNLALTAHHPATLLQAARLALAQQIAGIPPADSDAYLAQLAGEL